MGRRKTDYVRLGLIAIAITLMAAIFCLRGSASNYPDRSDIDIEVRIAKIEQSQEYIQQELKGMKDFFYLLMVGIGGLLGEKGIAIYRDRYRRKED